MMKHLFPLRRLRQRQGQAALEIFGVMGAWFLCTTLFFNMVFFLGSAMLIDSALDRAAMQSSSLGCRPDGVNVYFSELNRLGVHNLALDVRTTPLTDIPETTPNYYSQDPMSTLVAANGALQGQAVPCSGGVYANSGAFMVVQASYEQHLWLSSLFGTRTVRRNVVVVSHSLNGEG